MFHQSTMFHQMISLDDTTLKKICYFSCSKNLTLRWWHFLQTKFGPCFTCWRKFSSLSQHFLFSLHFWYLIFCSFYMKFWIFLVPLFILFFNFKIWLLPQSLIIFFKFQQFPGICIFHMAVVLHGVSDTLLSRQWYLMFGFSDISLCYTVLLNHPYITSLTNCLSFLSLIIMIFSFCGKQIFLSPCWQSLHF